MFVCQSAWNNSTPIEQKFHEILYVNIFGNISRKFKFIVLYKVLIIRPHTTNIQREDIIL